VTGSCDMKRAAVTLVLALLAVPAPARAAAPVLGDVAFYDGADNLADALGCFSAAVLNPARATPELVAALGRAGTRPLGRLSPGATADDLLTQARRLAVAGYQGALLELPPATTASAAADAVTSLRTVWPQGPLLLAADPQAAVLAAPELSAVVVRQGLGRAAQLVAFARAQLAAGRAAPLPIVDVESVPSGREQARRLVAQIQAAGLVPWVAIAGSDRLGMGTIEPIPRRVLVVRDRGEEPTLASSVAHRLLALPLEYLGYAVDYADARAPLPAGDLRARYAGIVSWFTDDDLPAGDRYEKWLGRQMDDGIKVAVLDHLGFSPSAAFLARLGLVAPSAPARPPLHVTASDDWVGFEAPAAARARDRPPWDAPGLTRHLELADGAGHRLVAVASGAWGGIALAPYVTAEGIEGRSRWILDPFRFLEGALALPPIPVPDATTVNGRRLMEIHIDGDGFVSVAELPDRAFAGEVIRREVLARYQLPTTVSIIEGEIGPEGLHADQSAALEEIARRIFARPEVEVASHTFSHPFDWGKAGAAAASDDELRDGDRLPIPGYVFSLEREIDGSVAYINKRLAPAGKPVRVLLWSGDALPPEQAIERTDALALENVNGDDGEEPGARLALSQVPSYVRPVGGRTQIYAPAQNENVYTNLWRGPFYGFRRVIDFFRFTDSPRRLKPIGIYYHFYSGTKAAALKALHDVYGWALQQETFPVWTSEYAATVRGFEEAMVGKRLDGSWVMRGFGALTTVRLPAALGWPDLDRSTGVVGVRDLPQGRYVALAPGGTAVLALASQAPAGPYLTAANAAVVSFRREGNQLHLRLRGHVPVQAEIGGCAGTLSVRRAPPPEFMRASAVKPRSAGNVVVKAHNLRFAESDTGEFDVVCR
jgi:polysaccharide biosynthesis protein PelA